MKRTVVKVEMQLNGDYADLIYWLENCPHADLLTTDIEK